MKRILVALDQSPRAAAVLAHACVIARFTAAELVLLHCVALPTGLPADAFRSSPGELLEQWRGDALRDLQASMKRLDPSLKASTLVRVGSPWSAICEAAKERDVDLVVIGSHGYDAMDHLLGTTAAKVVNHCDRSVLVVREPRRSGAAQG